MSSIRRSGNAQPFAKTVEPPEQFEREVTAERIRDVVGRGRAKHSEFKMGVGELSGAEFVKFLGDALSAAAAVSCDGAIHYVCMDWRHIGQLFKARFTGVSMN